MKSIYFIITLIYLAIFSCKSNSNSQNELSKSNGIPKKDTPKSIQEELLSNPITIDSSNLIKAFDNVYFGIKSEQSIYKYFNKEYSLSNIELDFDPDNYYFSQEFGLYKFNLIGRKVYNYNLMPEIIHDIKEIIEDSYPSGKKIKEVNESPYGIAERRLQAINPKTKKIPADYLSTFFIYQFIKNDKCIKIGYKIGYRPDNFYPIDYSYQNNFKSLDLIDLDSETNYTKFFVPLISFTYLPEYLKVERKEDSVEFKAQKEFKKKDVSKF